MNSKTYEHIRNINNLNEKLLIAKSFNQYKDEIKFLLDFSDEFRFDLDIMMMKKITERFNKLTEKLRELENEDI